MTSPRGVPQPTTVLYVDDEELARKYFGRSLGPEYEVLAAPDADAAIGLPRRQNSCRLDRI